MIKDFAEVEIEENEKKLFGSFFSEKDFRERRENFPKIFLKGLCQDILKICQVKGLQKKRDIPSTAMFLGKTKKNFLLFTMESLDNRTLFFAEVKLRDRKGISGPFFFVNDGNLTSFFFFVNDGNLIFFK